jgi:hypothetical protein
VYVCTWTTNKTPLDRQVGLDSSHEAESRRRRDRLARLLGEDVRPPRLRLYIGPVRISHGALEYLEAGRFEAGRDPLASVEVEVEVDRLSQHLVNVERGVASCGSMGRLGRRCDVGGHGQVPSSRDHSSELSEGAAELRGRDVDERVEGDGPRDGIVGERQRAHVALKSRGLPQENGRHTKHLERKVHAQDP